MRTRIALAATVAATFMTTSTVAVGTAGALSVGSRQAPGRTGSAQSPADALSVGPLSGTPAHDVDAHRLLTQLVQLDLRRLHPDLAGASAVPDPAPAAASAPVATPAPSATVAAAAPAAPAASAPAATPPPPPPDTDATSTTTPTWQCIRVHESGDRYNTPTAPSGAYGMLYSTWQSLGYSGWAYQYPASVQDAAALYLYNEFGWQPWSTKTVCGL